MLFKISRVKKHNFSFKFSLRFLRKVCCFAMILLCSNLYLKRGNIHGDGNYITNEFY